MDKLVKMNLNDSKPGQQIQPRISQINAKALEDLASDEKMKNQWSADEEVEHVNIRSKERKAKIVLNKHILGVMDKASSSVDQSQLSVFDKIYGRPGDQVRAHTELEANDIES